MKYTQIVFPVLSFAAGACLVMFRSGDGPAVVQADGKPNTETKGGSGRGKGKAGGVDRAGEVSPELLALAGLSGPPSMDDVLNGTGLDRHLRMAVWLRTATSEEMQAMLQRCQEEGVYDISLTDGIWMRWVEVDREAAMKSPVLNCSWWALAKVDPAGVVSAAAAAGPEQLKIALRALGQDNFESTLALLKAHPEAESNLVWEGILSDMARQDPARASGMALEKGMDLKETMQSWADRDPAAALKWAQSLEDPIKRRKAEGVALRELMTEDPAAAVRESGLLPAGKARTDLTAQALAALGRTDPDGALTAAEGMPNPADRQSALITLAGSFADSHPGKAMEIFGKLTTDGLPAGFPSSVFVQNGVEEEDMTSPMRELIPKLMAVDPEAVASFLAGQPDSDQRAIQGAVEVWVERDPEAASGWIQKLPPGDARDNAISSLTSWLYATGPEADFEAALAWSQAASAGQQEEILSGLLGQWSRADAGAAQAALDSLRVTEEERKRLQRVFPQSAKP